MGVGPVRVAGCGGLHRRGRRRLRVREGLPQAHPGARANALIHEMLHTLGLREDPPSSAEIARVVAERCRP